MTQRPGDEDNSASNVGIADKTATAAEAKSTARDGIGNRSFVALLVTQFLGALNDNIFRWIAVPVGALVYSYNASVALGAVLFTIPYLLLMNMAGFLADRYDKRTVIIACKFAEVLLASLVVASIVTGSVPLLFCTVLLMGCQSALFGPSKFSSIPELVKPSQISNANGLMAMVSVLAAAGGMFLGLWLFDSNQEAIGRMILGEEKPPWQTALREIWRVPAVLLGVALVGWWASLAIRRMELADADRRLSLNPFRDTVRDLKVLWRQPALFRASMGVAFFWVLGLLAQMNMPEFGADAFHLTETGKGLLLVELIIGLAAGAVIAGFISRGQVELGIVPLGALIIIAGSIGLCVTGELSHVADLTEEKSVTTLAVFRYPSFWLSSFFLVIYGFGAGLFTIPLEAYIQHRSDPKERGVVIAGMNFLAFAFMSLSAGAYYVMSQYLNLSPSLIFLLCGLMTLPVLIYVVWLLPQATVRFMVWLLSWTIYRVRVNGRENLPETGGALLVANHVSWVDGILLTLASARPIRLMADTEFFEHSRCLSWLAKLFNVVPIYSGMGPKAIVKALQTATDAINSGEVVCIFAEGRLTRTGQLQPFQRGLMRVVKGTDQPVVPVYLDELWGSVFSYHGGKILWKRPRKWPYPVSITFGPPLVDADNVAQVQQAVQNLGVRSAIERENSLFTPMRRFIRKCRRRAWRYKVADSSGQCLSGRRLLAATIALSRRFRAAKGEQSIPNVGVMLPPSVAGVVANTSLALAGRTAVNLNYTLSADDLNHCLEVADIKQVITTRKLIECLKTRLPAETLFIEDLQPQLGWRDRLVAPLQAYLLPVFLLERCYQLHEDKTSELMTVIFTSGSTGRPKGVLLDRFNVQSNIDAVDDMYHLRADDILLGVMPFFHSFGYTLNLWLTLTTDIRAVFHHNPLDAKTVGQLAGQFETTMLMGTPTFMRSYLKRIQPEEFQSLGLALVGAEKLTPDLAESFQQKFGKKLIEGYGATELSPLALANVPKSRTGADADEGYKPGTVGRAIPGISAKIVDPESGLPLNTNTEGLLLISGPNVMRGYLNDPEATAAAIHDGWYRTGDMAVIDDDGFVTITGRLSRFSKIAGEMVPHARIEEELNRIATGSKRVDNIESSGDIDSPLLAVTAVPDERKGERLVVVHRKLPGSVDELLTEYDKMQFPNLWRPAVESFIEVPELPLLGTGKLDLKQLKHLAEQHQK